MFTTFLFGLVQILLFAAGIWFTVTISKKYFQAKKLAWYDWLGLGAIIYAIYRLYAIVVALHAWWIAPPTKAVTTSLQSVKTHSFWSTFDNVEQWIIIAVTSVIGLVIVWNVISYFRDREVKTETDKKDDKSRALPPHGNKRWNFFVMKPRGYSINLNFLGRAYEPPPWQNKNSLVWKFWFFETAQFVPTMNLKVSGKTQLVNTAGEDTVMIPREITRTHVDEQPLIGGQTKKPTSTRGAQAQYQYLAHVYVRDAALLLEQDPDIYEEVMNLQSQDNPLLEEQVTATLSGDPYRMGLPQLLLDEAFILPGIVMLAAQDSKQFHGEKVSDDVEPEHRWDSTLALEVEVADTSKTLETINLSNKKELAAVAKAFPRSALGRLWEMGLGIAKFELVAFNPIEAAALLLQKRTTAILEREANVPVLQMNLDNAHGERAVREQMAIGSGRTLTAQFETLSDWIWEQTGGEYEMVPDIDSKTGKPKIDPVTGQPFPPIPFKDSLGRKKRIKSTKRGKNAPVDWRPDPAKLEVYIPAFEFMRRWQNNKTGSTILLGLGELIPELGSALKRFIPPKS